MQNYSLRQEPRYEPAAVIPLKQKESLLDWLQSNNRLIPREEVDEDAMVDEDEEISELMLDGEDRSFLEDEGGGDLED